MRRIFVVLAVALMCTAPTHGAGQASTVEAHPAFEVASVKGNPGGTMVLPDGRVASGTSVGSAGGRSRLRTPAC